MNIIEKYDKQFAYTSVVINLIMAYQALTSILINRGLTKKENRSKDYSKIKMLVLVLIIIIIINVIKFIKYL